MTTAAMPRPVLTAVNVHNMTAARIRFIYTSNSNLDAWICP